MKYFLGQKRTNCFNGTKVNLRKSYGELKVYKRQDSDNPFLIMVLLNHYTQPTKSNVKSSKEREFVRREALLICLIIYLYVRLFRFGYQSLYFFAYYSYCHHLFLFRF